MRGEGVKRGDGWMDGEREGGRGKEWNGERDEWDPVYTEL